MYVFVYLIFVLDITYRDKYTDSLTLVVNVVYLFLFKKHFSLNTFQVIKYVKKTDTIYDIFIFIATNELQTNDG